MAHGDRGSNADTRWSTVATVCYGVFDVGSTGVESANKETDLHQTLSDSHSGGWPCE